MSDKAHAIALTFDHVRRALQRPLPGMAAQARMSPRPRPGRELFGHSGQPQEAAVLIVVYNANGALHVVLTRRTNTVANHKGQISLPGGAREPGETLIQTALREAAEELAIGTAELEVLGTLTPLYVGASDYVVTPVVAIAPDRPVFRPDPREVVEPIEMPLSLLLDPAARAEEDWVVRGYAMRVPFYCVGPHKVWGATAMILAEFAALLEATLAPGDSP